MQGALERLTLEMTSTLDVDVVLARITAGLIEELGAALARVWLVGPGDACTSCAQAATCAHRERCLHLRASAGLSTRLDGGHRRVPLGALKIGQIAVAVRPVLTNDLEGDPRITDKAWVRAHGLASFAGYPLAFRGELLGVLAVFGRRPLSSEELGRLALFASQASVAIKNACLFAEVAALRERLSDENAYLREELEQGRGAEEILGHSPALRAAMDKLEQVAPTSATVLLLGETGTGKELFARALHAASRRRRAPLIKVSCAAISASLLESELFGHEKGAFTTALARHTGRFELAHGGTLFLDEIGELPLEAQAKLLRVLQEHEIERVGGTQSIPVDVRIVAATNRDLAGAVRSGRFREDLYYRLAVFPIEVPPLRARRADVPELAGAFVKRHARSLGKPLAGLSDDALAALAAYDWPGNVRELHNVIERAAIVARGAVIGRADLPDLTPVTREAPEDLPAPPAARGTLEDIERAHIRETLEACGWVIEGAGGAAVRLGLSPSTLRSRMARLSLRRPRPSAPATAATTCRGSPHDMSWAGRRRGRSAARGRGHTRCYCRAGMSHSNSIEAPGRLLHVSRAQFVGSLVACVALFLFATGPLWRHAGNIGRLDTAIGWSYGAIPLLIAGCLVASHRWSLRGFLLDTMALTLVKYIVTCSLAIAFWATVAPPRAAAASRPRPAPPVPEQALAPTPIDPARTGAVRVRVVDRAGRPLPDAVVFVAGGLEDDVFAPPSEPAVVEHGPRGIAPGIVVAQVGQRIEARSTDGRMHTLVASRAGEVLFNVPLLASGAPTTTRLRDGRGLATLRCNVHPEEPEGRLLALTHPYFGRSDAEGRVLLSGVPAGRLRIGAALGEQSAVESAVELRPRETAEVQVQIAAAP